MQFLYLYNSLGRKKERFAVQEKKVGMYVCGITPYDVTHLGHAFTYTFFDVLKRYLEFLGHQVTYVQNLTDIDDDILRKAKELNKNWRILGEENAQRFLQEMKWLNNIQPNFYVRATDHIGEIGVMIGKLLKKGLAYEKNGSVYFSVEKDKEYGKLSRLSKIKMLTIANERGNDANDENKKNPLDFVLWQAKKPGEPAWRPALEGRGSPRLQAGRPGWHIECSAMSGAYLGATFDIHGGGSDLIFPHHESEIAQSESANSKPFVKFWMHTGMLRYKGEKMSKSLGNLVLVSDLQKKYSENAVRILLLFHNYRSVWEFYEKDFEKATQLDLLFTSVWKKQSGSEKSFGVSLYKKQFFAGLNDDMNTTEALLALEKLCTQIVAQKKEANIVEGKKFLAEAFQILGLLVSYR